MAAAGLTPKSILAPATSDEIRQKLIDYMKAIPGFPIDDWEVGGVARTYAELERLGDESLIQEAIPAMVGSAAVDFANTPWLTIAARELYSLTRVAAVVAVQRMILTCDAGHGPYTIAAGAVWFEGLGGNRWWSLTGGTLNTDDTLAITISAEGPGARYNDPSGTIKKLLTPLDGVTAVNLALDFTDVTSPDTNTSTGTITVARTDVGIEPARATFIVRIDSPGNVGAGAWSYSADGGRNFVSGGVIGPLALLLADATSAGTSIDFADGVVSPGFVAGDEFSFATPGSSFLTVGQDEESDVALIARCKARWPDLTRPPTQSRYVKWAKLASAEVTRVRLEEDPVYLGKLYVTLAGLVGAVTGGAVTAVQDYIDPRAPIGRIIVARAASTWEIAASGVVTVPVASLARVQAAAQTAWTAAILASDIGKVVRVAALVRVVMDAGAIDFTAPALNGGGNVILSSTQVAILSVATPLLADQLTWVAI